MGLPRFWPRAVLAFVILEADRAADGADAPDVLAGLREFGGIGDRCGPFDATLLPIGAYEPRWFMRPVHMNPEEAVQAYAAFASAGTTAPPPLFVPMHWGTFRLTDEAIGEPPARLRAHWSARGLPGERLWIVDVGEPRALR